ncbi:MAG TPA: beta-ketoacyl synthase N-terminal-like domain-containing protein [Dehalococcoidia bacterium]|nr:beta-ketoacyl synthase N-terminal-like domain-containing protein [Dehalococcoidia bacterium]
MSPAIRQRQLGRPVSIVGAGMSQFGAFRDLTSRDLFAVAFQDLQAHLDQGIDVTDIQCAYVGNYSSDLFEGQGHTGPILADWLGMTPTPITRIENACASSGSALREGIMAIASGLYDVVLVGGVEKMTGLPTEGVTDVLASAADVLYEVPAGLTFPGIYAALAKAHMDRYETSLTHLLKVAIKNHQNGALNPKAQFNQSLRDMMERRKARARERGEAVPAWPDEMAFLNDPQANPWIAWPLRLFDCAPITDGAACVLLVAAELASSFTGKPVQVAGTGQASGRPLHDAEELTSLSAAKAAAAQAYQMSGVTAKDIQVAEVHDCFTIAEIIATEDLGFFVPGEGPRAVDEGRTARTGDKPINTSGGLKAKGHPVGASGVAQVIEVFHQLRGEAGPRQVPNRDLELGLTHNVGGTGGTCVVHVLRRG